MSSFSCVTFETLVPGASRSSWRVTRGPVTRPTIFASMPKWPSVSTSSLAICVLVRGVGRLALAGAAQQLRVGQPVVELLRLGHARAPLALRRAARDRGRPRRSSAARLGCAALDLALDLRERVLLLGARAPRPRPRTRLGSSASSSGSWCRALDPRLALGLLEARRRRSRVGAGALELVAGEPRARRPCRARSRARRRDQRRRSRRPVSSSAPPANRKRKRDARRRARTASRSPSRASRRRGRRGPSSGPGRRGRGARRRRARGRASRPRSRASGASASTIAPAAHARGRLELRPRGQRDAGADQRTAASGRRPRRPGTAGRRRAPRRPRRPPSRSRRRSRAAGRRPTRPSPIASSAGCSSSERRGRLRTPRSERAALRARRGLARRRGPASGRGFSCGGVRCLCHGVPAGARGRPP